MRGRPDEARSEGRRQARAYYHQYHTARAFRRQAGREASRTSVGTTPAWLGPAGMYMCDFGS